jgi:hypothetical protein
MKHYLLYEDNSTGGFLLYCTTSRLEAVTFLFFYFVENVGIPVGYHVQDW